MPSRITEADRALIAKARELRELRGPEAVREHAGSQDTAMAYVTAFGEAQELLGDLAIRLLTLGGS